MKLNFAVHPCLMFVGNLLVLLFFFFFDIQLLASELGTVNQTWRVCISGGRIRI